MRTSESCDCEQRRARVAGGPTRERWAPMADGATGDRQPSLESRRCRWARRTAGREGRGGGVRREPDSPRVGRLARVAVAPTRARIRPAPPRRRSRARYGSTAARRCACGMRPGNRPGQGAAGRGRQDSWKAGPRPVRVHSVEPIGLSQHSQRCGRAPPGCPGRRADPALPWRCCRFSVEVDCATQEACLYHALSRFP
jgi:hypothetical protein